MTETVQRQNGETPRRKRGRRAGCLVLLPFWFALLLSPCALFYLAANGEIRLDHRDIPQPHAHPLLLVSLISEKKERGLRIETSRIAERDDLRVCVETAARFLLWQGSAAGLDAGYCDCYERDDLDSAWRLNATYPNSCGGS